MKNKIILLLSLLVFLLNPYIVSAGDRVLSIQSIDITPYQEAIKGFQSVCTADIQRFVISEMGDKDIIKKIRDYDPSIILSIGVDALEKIKDIDDIPVIYLMVPDPQSVSKNAANFTGVRMNIKQDSQIAYFLKANPSMKTIGLLYDPDRTGYLAQKAIESCKKAGVVPIAKEIRESRDTPTEIKNMEGRIDGFWMLPDVTVFTSESKEYLFLFSMHNKIPILTFSELQLESGALISIGGDPFDMGAQAGEMAADILRGKTPANIKPVDARKEVISINMKIAKKLGLTIENGLFPNGKFLK